MKKQEMMMKSVLVRMGVKIRNVAPDQVLETVGYLAGVPGFESRKTEENTDKAETSDSSAEKSADKTETSDSADTTKSETKTKTEK